MSDKSIKHYKSVPANSADNNDVVVPNNETWKIQAWIGEAHPFKDTTVCIAFDRGGPSEEVVTLTHASSNHPLDYNAIGDGIKKLSIRLINDSSGPVDLGAEYTAKDGK